MISSRYNYAPFYSRPIECTDRDASFVLDGVLYHESDLDLEEHYTDTHGYTEINFAASACASVPASAGCTASACADPVRDHGVLEPVLRQGRRSANFRLLAEQWDRLGQFYAALPAGHTTASTALQRLNRFQASNRFYAANRELRPRAEDRVRLAVHVRATACWRLRPRCAGASSKSSNSTPWHAPCTTASAGVLAPARSTTR